MTMHRKVRSSGAANPQHSPRLFWYFAIFTVINALVVFSPVSRAAIVLYPASSFLLALFIIKRSKPAFVGLICWLFFLTPFVRRVVDWRGGGFTTVILLAPFLALTVAALALVPRWRLAVTRRTTPLFFVLGAILYGTAIAVLHFKVSGLPQAIIAWFLPLVIAFFIFEEREHSEEIYKGFEHAMVGGLFVIGLYGIYQFFQLPAWDAQWMIQSDLVSIGLPEPTQVRVFSTMNSPQVFAAFCTGGLLVALRSHLRLRYFAVPLGLIALILSLSRTAWIGLIVGILYLFLIMDNRQRARIVAVAGSCLIFSLVALQVPEFKTLATQRFSSFTDPSHDSSYNTRVQDYGVVLRTIAENPFGLGLSSDSDDQAPQANNVAQQDSSITDSVFALGILGAAIFVLGSILIGFDIFVGRGHDTAMIGAKATLLAIFAESPFNSVIAGPIAFLLWCCVGLCLAERERMSAQERHSQPEIAESPLSASAAPAN